MPNFGIIKEVFASPEDVINDEIENVIVEPAEDPTIPTEDEDSGEGGAGLVADISLGDTVEPDSTDIIWPIEDIELNEPAVAAEQYEPEPIVSNQALLPTLGAVQEGDRVIIALINGEATVIGTVGSGDAQNARIATIEQVAGDTNQYFWHTSTGTDTGAHITQIPQEDFLTTPSGGNTLIRSNGMAVRDGLTELAKFTATGIQIGQDTQNNVVIDYHSFQQISKEGTPYVYFSDLRDADGVANIVETFDVSSARTIFNLTYPVEESTVTHPIVITADDVAVNAFEVYSEKQIRVLTPIAGEIVISYWTASAEVKAFTFGTRGEGKVGAMSYSEGIENVSSGRATHAEGYHTIATGDFAHAEGNQTRASGYSHAEGWRSHSVTSGSHAEGIFTLAGGVASHSEGYETIAEGVHSHAAGRGTIAKGTVQTAIGKYNLQDNNETYALIIGNGDSTNRSNALTVDWNGNVVCGKINGKTIPTPDGTTIVNNNGVWSSVGGGGTTYTAGTGISIVNNVIGVNTAVALRTQIPTKVSDLTNDSGFISSYTETDPIFTASAAYGITSTDITNWNNKSTFSGSYNDLTNKPTIPTVPTNISSFTNDAGYITSYTETDPVFSASAASTITSNGIVNWNNTHNTHVGNIKWVNNTNDITLAIDGIKNGTTYSDISLFTIYNSVNASDNNLKHLLSRGTISSAIASKQDALPSISGKAGKVLAVNSGATGYEWVAQTNYTAGTGISITNGVISLNLTQAESESY